MTQQEAFTRVLQAAWHATTYRGTSCASDDAVERGQMLRAWEIVHAELQEYFDRDQQEQSTCVGCGYTREHCECDQFDDERK